MHRNVNNICMNLTKREEAQIKSNAHQEATTDEQENGPKTKMDHTKSWKERKTTHIQSVNTNGGEREKKGTFQ